MARRKHSERPRSELLNVSDVLQSLLSNGKSPLADQFLRWRMWRSWRDMVGEEVGRCSMPVDLKRGRLLVWVKSSAAMNELSYVLESLRLRINAFMGVETVKSIRLTLDQKQVPTDPDALPELDRL